jgi:hypothetical protein
MTTNHPPRDLDTVTGRQLALTDAADELGRLRAGQSVTVRRPGRSEARLTVQSTFAEKPLSSDPHGRPYAGGVLLSYGPGFTFGLAVTPYEVAFAGWSVTSA